MEGHDAVEEPTWRRKICVVGSSGAGKTSLSKSIVSMTPMLENGDDGTFGVGLYRLEFVERVTRDGSIEHRKHDVTLWDFGGRDEFRAANTLFFSQRALYLICVDMDEFDQVMHKAHACENDDEAESLVLEFVRERVWRWFLSIFARQPEAECFMIATKTDALGGNATSRLKLFESELFPHLNELKQQYDRGSLREIKALQKLLAQSKADADIDTRIESLQRQVEASIPTSWIGLNVCDPSSVEHARTSIEDLLKQSDRSFVMSDKYSRVLKRVEELQQQSQQAMIRNRIKQSFVSLPGLVQNLMSGIEGLTEDEAKTILKTLHDLGVVLWYAFDGHHILDDTVVLDVALLIDFVRQIMCHDLTGNTMVTTSSDIESEMLMQAIKKHGTVSNELLRHTFSLWKRLVYPEQLLQFKQLLEHFNLAYPTGGDVMQADSDLIVPAYWPIGEKRIDLGRLESLSISGISPSQAKHYLWEYYLGDNSLEVVETVFEQLVVRSYHVFPNRVVRGRCVESVGSKRCAIRTACGWNGRKGPAVHLEVLGVNDRESSAWLRDLHDAIEGVLGMFPGILVNRRAVMDGTRWNLDEWIPKWRQLSDNRRAFQLREYSWPPYDVVEWYRRAGGGARKWFISPESIVKCDGPALAQGGFGLVYQAKWQHIDVVVKEMTESEIRRFMGEVNMWWELRHDNVVRFLGANHRVEPYFIVSSYATNGPLVSYLKSEKTEKNRVVVWRKLREVAAGLCHLHGHGIVHGDLKGNNIVVAKDGTAMLVDFGLSFVEAGSLSVVKEIKDTLGAMQWRAPEFAKLTIERPTRKSDVYSLGMCIIEAVTGEKPWNGYSRDEIRSYLRKGEVKVDKPDAMTDAQWELVRQMIAPSPKDRPELDAVISKLEGFAKDEELAENPYAEVESSLTPDAA